MVQTVWMDRDLVHAVEPTNGGAEDSSVFYIPSLPHTERNLAYVRRQREHFRQGRTPPDFPPNDSEREFTGRGQVADLTPLGKRLMGFGLRTVQWEPKETAAEAVVAGLSGVVVAPPSARAELRRQA